LRRGESDAQRCLDRVLIAADVGQPMILRQPKRETCAQNQSSFSSFFKFSYEINGLLELEKT